MTDSFKPRAGLNTQILQEELKKRSSLWQEFVIKDEVGSTNDEIKDISKKEGFFLLANFQTKGRGRQNRSWIAPKNSSIFISLYLNQYQNGKITWIPLIVSLALCKTIETYTNLDIKIKWPNDLVAVDSLLQKKFSGILVESEKDKIIVGVGVNFDQDKSELPVEDATSLKYILKSFISKEEIISAFISELSALWLEESRAQNWPTPSLIREYKKRCITINQIIKAQLVDGQVLHGKVLDISENGELVLDSDTGIKNLSSADIFLAH